MKVITHFSTSEENINELKKKVAIIHAEAVIKHLCKCNCPMEQKKKLLDNLIHNYNNS